MYGDGSDGKLERRRETEYLESRLVRRIVRYVKEGSRGNWGWDGGMGSAREWESPASVRPQMRQQTFFGRLECGARFAWWVRWTGRRGDKTTE